MRKALLGLLVAASSCRDFTLVDPELPQQPTEPSMSVLVVANRSDNSRYQLRAFFYSGTDARGQFLEVADRAVYVDDNPVQPSFDRGSGLWDYDWTETREDGGVDADSLRLRPPVLASSPSSEFTMTVPIAGREDPADVTWSEGQDLRLHVSPPIGAATQFPNGPTDWTLELGDACEGAGTGRALRVAGSGPYPPEFRIPWEWLPSGIAPPAVACLRAASIYRVSSAPYRMDVFVDLRLTWRIRVVRTT